MNRDTYYFSVGLFVIVTLVAGFFFIDLFTERDDRKQLPYVIHFATPVDGLVAGNEVRYMGVKVGSVTAVRLIREPTKNATRVEVTIKLLAETPLDTATVAVLRTQMLTGLPFLNLLQSELITTPTPLTTSVATPAIIPTQLSDIDSVLNSLPKLENRLDNILGAIENLLNPTNQKAFAGLLHNLEKSSAEVPSLLGNLQQTSQQFTATAEGIDKLVSEVQSLIVKNEDTLNKVLTQSGNELGLLLKTSTQTVGQVRQLVSSLTRTSERLNITAQDVGGAVNKVGFGMNNSMEHLNETLQAIRSTALELRNLTEILEQDPSRIIYQSSPQGIELPR